MKKISFLLLFLLISFGSISAVLFTPALPEIRDFFHITDAQTQLTVTLFLAGYALGQLLYGPLGNGFGRKKTLYFGIILEIIACILCFIASAFHFFGLLVFARFMMALGSSVGLQMTFTLVSDCYETEEGRRVLAHVMMSFAVTPGLGVALGGLLTTYFGWESCFVALLVYGFLLLFLVNKAPETAPVIHKKALSLSCIILQYQNKFKNKALIAGGILIGISSCCNYIFLSIAPFIADSLLNMDPAVYGLWNLLPSLGIIAGTQFSAHFLYCYSMNTLIISGLGIAILGASVMLLFLISPFVKTIGAFGLFFPQMIIFFGSAFILVNASARSMQSETDKSNGSAVMNFMAMLIPTLNVFTLGIFHTENALILPLSLLGLMGFGFLVNYYLKN